MYISYIYHVCIYLTRLKKFRFYNLKNDMKTGELFSKKKAKKKW